MTLPVRDSISVEIKHYLLHKNRVKDSIMAERNYSFGAFKFVSRSSFFLPKSSFPNFHEKFKPIDLNGICLVLLTEDVFIFHFPAGVAKFGLVI